MPAAGYQGIYVEVDPYAATDPTATAKSVGLGFLQSAAQTACNGSTGTYAVFCTSGSSQMANGIFLQIPWCNWELDSTSTSCLYVVNPAGYASGTMNGPAVQQDVTSACTTTYDNCVPNGTTSLTKCPLSGSPTAAYGVLFQALYYICQIDEQRAAVGLGPLILSIGLEAGVRTPVYVQNMIGGDGGPGTIDLAYTASKPDGTNAGYVCGRVPDVWTASYATAYGNAFTALVNYIGAANNYVASRPQLLANGPKLVAAKIDGINADTAEFALSGSSSIPNMPGTDMPYTWMTDMGNGSINAGISCAYMNTQANGMAGTTAAQHWLDTFGQTIHTTVTFAQAVEEDFGMITGYEYGAMAAASTATPNSVSATFLLAIELRDSATFPDDNCGKANSGQTIYGVGQVGPGQSNSCVVDPPYMTGDTWTTYYPVEAILGLTSSAAYTSGKNATKVYASFNAQFGFNQLALNTTDLQLYPTQLSFPGPMPPAAPSPTATSYQKSTGCTTSYTQCQLAAMHQLPCNLNNLASTPTADLGVIQLLNNNGSGGSDVNYTIPGVQTLLGSQTAFSDVHFCGSSTYDTIMKIAADNGSGYIEISPPEATAAACQPSYATILPALMNQTQTNCLYGSQ